MKHAVSISLGSSSRDQSEDITLLGEAVRLERRGTDGDAKRAAALFTELDGQVDALGVGGIDLAVHVDRRAYPLRAAQKLVAGVHQTPIVDGSGIKDTLERQVVEALVEQLGTTYQNGRVVLTAAVDRSGMTMSFVDAGYDVLFGDLMFVLGLPIPIRTYTSFRRVARLLAAPATMLPISVLYPTGDKQHDIKPRFEKWYRWADVLAGDCHYIKQHMPNDLSGKIVVTNTTTREDMTLFKARGVAHVMTTTPVINGRSFGTNMLEAALVALAGKGRRLTSDELRDLIGQLDLKPTVHTL